MSFLTPHSLSSVHPIHSRIQLCSTSSTLNTLGAQLFLSILTPTFSFFLLDHDSNFFTEPLPLQSLLIHLFPLVVARVPSSKSAHLIISLLFLQHSTASPCLEVKVELLHVAYTQLAPAPSLQFCSQCSELGQTGTSFSSLIAPCFCLQALDMPFPV